MRSALAECAEGETLTPKDTAGPLCTKIASPGPRPEPSGGTAAWLIILIIVVVGGASGLAVWQRRLCQRVSLGGPGNTALLESIQGPTVEPTVDPSLFDLTVESDLFAGRRRCAVTALTLTELHANVCASLGITVSIAMTFYDEDFQEFVAHNDFGAVPRQCLVKLCRLRSFHTSHYLREYRLAPKGGTVTQQALFTDVQEVLSLFCDANSIPAARANSLCSSLREQARAQHSGTVKEVAMMLWTSAETLGPGHPRRLYDILNE